MKIYFISDIHLESNLNPDLDFHNDSYLILIGDICRVYPKYNLQRYYDFLYYCSLRYLKVFLIPGNNEYYNNIYLDINTVNNILQNLCLKFNNVYFLNNKTYDLNSKIRIVGSVLFNYTPLDKFKEALELQQNCNNFKPDCRNIYIKLQNTVFPLDFRLKNAIFKFNTRFLISEIKKAKIENKKLIVCTHYIPSKKMMYDSNRIGSYNFYSNLDFLIKDPIIIWLFGHSHKNINLKYNNVLCSMNTLGHSHENTKYIKNKHISFFYI